MTHIQRACTSRSITHDNDNEEEDRTSIEFSNVLGITSNVESDCSAAEDNSLTSNTNASLLSNQSTHIDDSCNTTLNSSKAKTRVSLNSMDSHESIQRFFVQQNRIGSTLPVDQISINSCDIHSTLRPYQVDTVRWMVMRETKSLQIQLGEWSIDLPAGGVLADEMGLGKTVEVLACILSHPKYKVEVKSEIEATNESFDENLPNTNLGKRPSTLTRAHFLRKKPRLSIIKQNPTLKKEIATLLDDYFTKFNRLRLKKNETSFNDKCLKTLEICFKIILLHSYYNRINLEYARQQTWGYLVSEFDVHEPGSIGYLISLKHSPEKKQKLPPNEKLSDEDATTIVSAVASYLGDKVLKQFEKEFYWTMRFSINKSAGEIIPLLESGDIKCSCGSDRTKGRKVQCSSCHSMQHLKCVGLEEEPDDPDTYFCPSCWMKKPVIESAATLIVVPGTLTQQWCEEINKHAAECNLKVFRYKGVKSAYVLPPLLASYDIVIVAFSDLGDDLSFTEDQSRSLRHAKRYQSFITPLTCIKWWRLCIDEAQTVENVNHVSKMAALLQTCHLWAVTGTPISKSLHDLYGLTTFLRMEPFTESKQCWNDLISGDQSLLHTLFAHLMRRMTKQEVNEQLQLPDLKVETQWLSFSPTEGYFYNTTHTASQNLFMQKINKIANLDQPLSKAHRRTVDSVLPPLLSLRQACVNPMAVKNLKLNLFNVHKDETMQELLKKMIKKTKIECEDILRLYIMLVNGSARLSILGQKFTDAVALYRSIFFKTKMYIDLKPDDFQMIHIMHNLYESSLKDSSIELTEDEKQFPEKVGEMEKKALDKLQEELTTMKQQLSKYNSEISDYMNSFELKHFDWWGKMLKAFNFTEILTRVHESLEKENIALTGDVKLKLSSVDRLREALKYWLADVESKREVTFLFLEQVTNITKRESLWSAADSCHIRKDEPKKSCLICRMESVMLKYEALLFNISNKNDSKSNWQRSALECVLNVLLSCSRSSFGTTPDVTNAAHQMKILGLLKREFRAVRAVWSKQCDLLNVFDEIHMAKSTFEDVTTSSELLQSGNTVFEHEVGTYRAQSTSTHLKLQSKYGSLQYLKNLDKKYENAESIDEACPVCHMSMDEKRAVMVCGHFTCYGCMQALIERCLRNHILCPICRSSAPVTSITYVHGGGTSSFDSSEVQGHYSVKILAITAKVLALVKEEPNVKILVFSAWKRALEVIERAFIQNKISFEKYNVGGDQRRASLTSFKNNEKKNVMLMPLRSGSKGLNLTEASHIIFTEPVLNLADEKQAIGRIDRLGQCRQMTVHKFIVKCTVEENLHRMTEELQQNSNNEGGELTFRHLRALFEASASNLNEV